MLKPLDGGVLGMETRVFLAFVVGLCLLVGGGSGYAVTVDQDWQVSAFNAKAEAGSGVAYESLSSERQRTVDAVLDGGPKRVEERSAAPPGLVTRDDTAYAFQSRAVTDFDEAGHPFHFPFLGVAVLGALLTAESIRRHHAPHWTPWRRVMPSRGDS
jgi:hypothetical protein